MSYYTIVDEHVDFLILLFTPALPTCFLSAPCDEGILYNHCYVIPRWIVLSRHAQVYAIYNMHCLLPVCVHTVTSIYVETCIASRLNAR